MRVVIIGSRDLVIDDLKIYVPKKAAIIVSGGDMYR